MQVKVFALLPVLLGLCGCSLEEDKVEIQVKDETCSDYCAATYPEHTYPDVSLCVSLSLSSLIMASPPLFTQPDDHCACTRGCRMAVMDALMSWPFAPKRSFCLSSKTQEMSRQFYHFPSFATACKEAYGSDGHFYACQTGCNVTTIYQKVPNSDQIYQSSSTGGSPELGIVMEMLQAISKQLPNDDQMEKLTQQAESMYRLLPGGARVSTFVIIQENVSQCTIWCVEYWSRKFYPLTNLYEQASKIYSLPSC